MSLTSGDEAMYQRPKLDTKIPITTKVPMTAYAPLSAVHVSVKEGSRYTPLRK